MIVLSIAATRAVAATAPANGANPGNTSGVCCSPCETQKMTVQAVGLSASKSNKTVTACGTVTVTDGSRRQSEIQSATVSVTWTYPSGTKTYNVTKTATTDKNGVATFKIDGTVGKFTFKVTEVKKPGYTLEDGVPAAKTITKT